MTEGREDPHHEGAEFVSGKEAAALLGVKRETLYAYASRGLVRSEPGGAGRERRYSRDDLERLKARRDARSGHGPVAAGALRWGEPVLESALTAIEATGPRYRGRPAVLLAEAASFEAVAELLWSGVLPERPPRWSVAGLGVRLASLTALLPEGAPPLVTLALAVPALAAADPDRFNPAPAPELVRARALIVRMAALAGAGLDVEQVRPALAEADVAGALLVSLGAPATARARQVMGRALVLSADHELNASAFAVRVAASAGADLYACVCAGLATLSGPRHGGMADRVEALVTEVGKPERARAVVQERARRGEEIPGFGHPLYPDGDPRAAALLAAAVEHAPRSPRVRTIHAIACAMRDAGRERPNFDVGLVALGAALGLPPRTTVAIFAVGRAAGWLAHAFEQRAAGFLLRPRARYVGP
ncbi:citrate/2-methylcitrate synthase [Nannocystis punicea]|uniref:citrate synthase (unknown stereospecificity) n=1 Tax=Nannocystis punicea TaxID=2995304 RepID=A0ABY7GW66_9BACT|nr:citrate/2-methylcitrate synthase [Nannocystis poenicansa]WAS91226.1 helix-turn-helix domain-containing protein [Nannocystis poenicansa]